MKEHKKIKVLGITRDFNVCDCCGKENLTKTVSILDLDHGVVSHYGVTCAAKADKYDNLNVMKDAKKQINKAKRDFNLLEENSFNLAWQTLKAEYGTTVTTEPDFKISLNCDARTFEDCKEQAFKHLSNEETKFKPFIFY